LELAAEQFLTGTSFADLIRAGHQRLHEQAGVVNSLNIFPVPDGDTGTNMDLSLGAGVAALNRRSEWELREAVTALTTGLLMGARGNSGVILSQLFRGFVKVTQSADFLDARAFAQALAEGVEIAYRAVSKPVEGTILTVAREAAQTGVREARQDPPLAVWMGRVYEAARLALARTPEQLPVLKQAGVVDSGGQGLVFIYEGFLQYLSGEASVSQSVATVGKLGATNTRLDYAGAHIAAPGEYGYCTEVLVRVGSERATKAERQLREQFARYGDSLLVVAADDLIKVHVHTLHPGRVLEDALSYGPLLQIKIENMTEQHAGLRGHEDRVAGSMTANDAVDDAGSGNTSESGPRVATALVAVAAGDGLQEIFRSLGAQIIIDGGQTMNPSTEEIVAAAQKVNADHVIVLPNNKNIVLAAEQAQSVLGERLHVVKSTTIPQGIAAATAFQPRDPVEQNRTRMEQALQQVKSGSVVCAVRDSQYQGHAIRAGQYLGIADQDLVEVGDDRAATAIAVVRALAASAEDTGAELLTIFYGNDVTAEERKEVARMVATLFSFEVELRYGGQPIYDYIFALE
jgi:DAK2 domain fusion protein YloV